MHRGPVPDVGYAYGHLPPGPPGPVPPHTGAPPPAKGGTPVLSIVGLVLALLLPLVGVVLSVIALVRQRNGTGRGLAIAGIAVGVVMISIHAAVVIPLYLNQQRLTEDAEVRAAWERVVVALTDGDCDALMAGTTPTLRKTVGLTTCEEIEATAGPRPGTEAIVGVAVDEDTATVHTREAVVLTDGEAPTEQAFDYGFVRRSGEWVMDSVVFSY